MRALVRPFLLFAALCGFAAISQSQPAPGGQVNVFVWTSMYPVPMAGGVNTSVDITPAPSWACTDVTIRVIDAGTNKTLGEYSVENPGGTVQKGFGGLPNNLKVRVTADGVFKNGALLDFKQLEAFVTTH